VAGRGRVAGRVVEALSDLVPGHAAGAVQWRGLLGLVDQLAGAGQVSCRERLVRVAAELGRPFDTLLLAGRAFGVGQSTPLENFGVSVQVRGHGAPDGPELVSGVELGKVALGDIPFRVGTSEVESADRAMVVGGPVLDRVTDDCPLSPGERREWALFAAGRDSGFASAGSVGGGRVSRWGRGGADG
jgi:hypothetical protein